MATSNTRDVKMTLSVETLGADEIKKLQSSVSALAKEGGDAAPEFQRLADEIGRLGDQAEALRSFEALAQSTQDLAQRQREAAVQSDALSSKLQETSGAVREAAAAERAAITEYNAANRAKIELAGALTKLRSEYDAAGKKTDEYKTKLATLVDAQTANKTSLIELGDARDAATAALVKAEENERKLIAQYERSEETVKSLSRQLENQTREMGEQRQMTEALGVSTEDTARSQAQLLQALNGVANAAQQARNDLQAVAAEQADLDAQAAAAAARIRDRTAATAASYAAEEAAAEQAAAAARQRATQEQAASDAVIAARREEQAESDRLANLQIATRQRMELAARNALAAEMAAQREAADLTKRLETEKLQAIEAGARKQAAAISNAFGTVGVRGAAELREEIARVRAAMDTLGTQAGLTGAELRAAMASGNAQIKDLQRELRAVTGEMTLADRAANLLKNSMGQIAAGNLIADGIGYLVNQVKDMGRQFIEANLEMERLQRTMTVITGSAEGAAQKISFLREVANTAGQAVGGITDSFIRFNASASASGLAAEQIDSIFKAVTVNGSKMGMTTDRVALALDALGQIASKGTVSMEELRQQLGDSLPGAFAITAKGLGVTTAELVKMVETGNLAANDFFPAFRKGLEDTFGSAEKTVEGLFQAWNRLRNAFRELYQEATGSTAFQLLASGMDALAANLRTVVDVTYGLGKALVALKLIEYIKSIGDFGNASRKAASDIATKTAAVAADTAATSANTSAVAANTAAKTANANASKLQAAAVATNAAVAGTFTGAIGLAARGIAGFGGAVRGALSILGGLPGLLVTVALNARDLGTWIGEGIAKWAGWGKVLDENEKKLKAQADAEKAAAQARRDAQAESDRAFQREIVNLTKSREALEGKVAAAEKGVEADKVRADNLEKIANLYGDEATKLDAATQAAEINLGAVEREAQARQTLLAAAEAELAAKDKLLASNTNVSEKVREQTEELRNSVEKMRESTAESVNTVRQMQIEVAERKIAAQSVKDNSDRVDEYRGAMEAARENLAGLIEMQKQGLPVSTALAKAEIDLAVATRLYRDASADLVKSIDLKAQSKGADLKLSIAGLQAQLEEAKASERIAIANGNEVEARRQKIRQKEIELEIFKKTVELQIIEAQGSLDIAKAKLAEVKANEPLNTVKIKELETTIKIAEATLVLAKARGQQTEALERELNALRNNTNAKGQNKDAAGKTAAALAEEREARLRNLSTIEEENDKLAEQNNLKKVGSQYYNRDGFAANPDGSVISVAVENRNSVYNKAKSAGLSATKSEEIAKQFIGERGETIGWSPNEPWAVALQRVIGEAVRAQDLASEGAGGTPGAVGALGKTRNTTSRTTEPTTSQSNSTVRTLRLQIGNGPSTDVNVASSQDAAALESFLSQLETSAGRST